jgi:alanine racemase
MSPRGLRRLRLTWRATRPTRIAVLPVGYYEGYDRELSGLAHVLIRGRRAPVRGRVCMNMCMVDVTDIPGPRWRTRWSCSAAKGTSA